MEQAKIDMFITQNRENFVPGQLATVKAKLEEIDDSKFSAVQCIEFKKPSTVLIISIFFGSLGVDRFLIGETGLGIAKLLTCGGCGIWTIIDWFNIQDKVKQYNYKKFFESTIV